MIDKNTFVSNFPKELDSNGINRTQIQGFGIILDYWNHEYPDSDLRYLAYLLATCWHESGFTMQPVEEVGHGKGHNYGTPDPITGKAYFGRGLVQITWKTNYSKFSHLMNIDLVEKPELALQPIVSTQIAFLGMFGGLFTGKRLGDYFNSKTEDWVNARKIINSLDCAQKIAEYGKHFNELLKTCVK
jgi:hypothetical protein